MKIKKHLSLQPLIDGFKQAFNNYKDTRRENSVNYPILDTALSALACMFYKSGSLINYQRNMEDKHHKNNLQTQFEVTSTPKDNQMRKIIGSIPSEQLAPVFSDYLSRLQRGKHLEKYRFQDKYLVAIDGTDYYSSDSVDCPCCLTQTKRNGETRYYHKVLQPIICHPDCKQILPLMPEEIKNEDGSDKQDSEVAAAYRLLPAIRKQHPKMNFIWLTDSLFATAPFITKILDAGEDFISRVKKGDHKNLFKAIDSAPYESFKVRSNNGKTTIAHRIYKGIQLNASTSIEVTVIQAFAITKDKKDNVKSTIIGTWATNLEVNKDNIAQVTKAARARWKIESVPQAYKVVINGFIVNCCKAVGKMVVGPLKSAIRSRFQTTPSGCY